MKTITLLALFAVAALLGQDKPFKPSISEATFSTLSSHPTAFTIMGDNGNIAVTIHSTGKVEFGPGVTPDEAAKQFAAAMEKLGMKFGCGDTASDKELK